LFTGVRRFWCCSWYVCFCISPSGSRSLIIS
jgi:hypothetical protein